MVPFEHGIDVSLLIIGFPGLPDAEEDADPPHGKFADDGVIGFSFGLVVFDECFGPPGVFPAFGGELVEALGEESVAAQPSIDPLHIPALFGDRSHADQAGHVGGVLAVGRMGGKSGEDAWSVGGAGSG